MEGTGEVDNWPVGVDKADESSGSESATSDDSVSPTKVEGKGTKRKNCDDLDERFLSMLTTFGNQIHSAMNQMLDNLRVLGERVGADSDAAKNRRKLYDVLSPFAFCSIEEKLEVALYLCNNSNLMDAFYSMPDEAKAVLVRNIIKEVGGGDGGSSV